MKIVFFIMLMLINAFCTLNIYCKSIPQEKVQYQMDLVGYYPLYVLKSLDSNKKYKPNWKNYGVGLEFSLVYKKKLTSSLGINYQTRNYKEIGSDNYVTYYYNDNFRVQYYSLNSNLGYRIYSRKRLSMSINGLFSIQKISNIGWDYDFTWLTPKVKNSKKNNLKYDLNNVQTWGYNAALGFSSRHYLNDRFSICFASSISKQFSNDMNGKKLAFLNYSGQLLYSFRISLGYLFKNNYIKSKN